MAALAASVGTLGVACGAGVCASGRCGSLASCRATLEAAPASPSGTYVIDPDGVGGAAPQNGANPSFQLFG